MNAEQWLKDLGADLVDCRRYHARLTEEACARYRRANPDACKGCASAGRCADRGSAPSIRRRRAPFNPWWRQLDEEKNKTALGQRAPVDKRKEAKVAIKKGVCKKCGAEGVFMGGLCGRCRAVARVNKCSRCGEVKFLLTKDLCSKCHFAGIKRKKSREAKPAAHALALDFSAHEDLYKSLAARAAAEIRSVEHQALWEIGKGLRAKDDDPYAIPVDYLEE